MDGPWQRPATAFEPLEDEESHLAERSHLDLDVTILRFTLGKDDHVNLHVNLESFGKPVGIEVRDRLSTLLDVPLDPGRKA